MQMGSGAALFEHTCCFLYQAKRTFDAKTTPGPEQSVVGAGRDMGRLRGQRAASFPAGGYLIGLLTRDSSGSEP